MITDEMADHALNNVTGKSWRDATKELLEQGAFIERAAIVATARNCPEPIVNAMMEARARDTPGRHMADQIRRMLLEFADAIDRGDHSGVAPP